MSVAPSKRVYPFDGSPKGSASTREHDRRMRIRKGSNAPKRSGLPEPAFGAPVRATRPILLRQGHDAGGGVYFKTWDIEGSLTRRGYTPSGGCGTTIGEVGPDRARRRVYIPDQRVGTSLRCGAWQAMRSGGATPPRCRAPKLDLVLRFPCHSLARTTTAARAAVFAGEASRILPTLNSPNKH